MLAPLNDAEKLRLQEMLKFETEAYSRGHAFVVGIDEAGRGPLAGPVVAAACVLPPGFLIENINDSKKLSKKKRAELFHFLITHQAISYSVAIVDAQRIDAINIYQATMEAMRDAVRKLSVVPDCLLVDGLHLTFPQKEDEHFAAKPSLKIIKGDQLSCSIAAASIIAKESRDALMQAYHDQWPEYGFADHKGYGTKKHLQALNVFGPCPIHRLSFEPVKTYVSQGCKV